MDKRQKRNRHDEQLAQAVLRLAHEVCHLASSLTVTNELPTESEALLNGVLSRMSKHAVKLEALDAMTK